MSDSVLIVDDSKVIRMQIAHVFDQYCISHLSASNGLEALEILDKNHEKIKTITLDREMPKMNGIEFLQKIKNNKKFINIPVIFISSLDRVEDISIGLENRAYDYLTKPINPQLTYLKIRNSIEYCNQKKELEKLNSKLVLRNNKLESLVESRTKKITEMTGAILNVMETTAGLRDEDTGQHIQRVAEYSFLLANELKLSKALVRNIKYYAPLHDIGKIGIPDKILKKPWKLTEEEFDIMKTHVDVGVKVFENYDLPDVARNIIKYHHEKWNGKGYTERLKGEEIPIEARIVSVADVFDALTNKRVYKEAFSIEKALKIMRDEVGVSFDPKIMDLFFKNMSKILKIKESLK